MGLRMEGLDSGNDYWNAKEDSKVQDGSKSAESGN